MMWWIIGAWIAALWPVYENIRRLRLRYGYELVPNCLLTRYPLVFVTGRRSIFYFLRYWNFIPDYLQDHGYEVMNLSLDWRNADRREREILEFLRQMPFKKVHLVGDVTALREFQRLAPRSLAQVASYWIVADKTQIKSMLSKDSLIRFLNWQETPHAPAQQWRTKILWTLHRLAVRWKSGPSPDLLGFPSADALTQTAKHYLDFAISLAEEDL